MVEVGGLSLVVSLTVVWLVKLTISNKIPIVQRQKRRATKRKFTPVQREKPLLDKGVSSWSSYILGCSPPPSNRGK